MSDIVNRFKNVFISPNNSNYLFNIIINKLNQRNIHVTENLELYKQNFLELQSMIYNDNFVNIYNDHFNKNQSVNLEDVLIKLNQIAVTKFEFIVSQNYIQKNYLQQIQQNEQKQNVLIENNLEQNEQKQNVLIENNLKQNEQKQNVHERNNKKNNYKSNKKNHVMVKKEERGIIEKKDKNTITENNTTKINFINFFSDDANFINNKYEYDIKIENLKSIYLESINLLYDMYNITNYNNKFYLLEGSHKHLITIPIGFYVIDKLLDIITKSINFVSINKNNDYKFLIYKNKIKNKVYITCDWIKSINDKDIKRQDEKTRDKSVLDFGIIFVSNNTSQNNYSLCEILGFDKNEYLNNNMYIGEKSPIENIYQNIYFKLFINDIEIERYYTTKETFTYYDKINFNLQSNYGNKICHIPNLNTPYDIDEELEMNKISFQFNNSIDYIINLPLNFDIVMGFEYITF
jgi:hypothetical protein